MSFTNGPAFIRSADNPELALSVAAYPPRGDVTLENVPADDWNSPLSQWVFAPVAEDVYQILLFASSNHLCLTPASASVGSTVGVEDTDPTNELQLWKLTGADDLYWLSSASSPMTELGFAGDFPVPGMTLGLEPAHDKHALGDKFTITRAQFPA